MGQLMDTEMKKMSVQNCRMKYDQDFTLAYYKRKKTKLKSGDKVSGFMDLNKAGEIGYEEVQLRQIVNGF
jgi:hypothetical protein